MSNIDSHTNMLRRRASKASSSSGKQTDSIRATSSSSALSVKVNSASSCSSLPISWDATKGKAPWTVMIALTDNVPFTFNVPQDSGANTVVNWDIPKLSKSTQALVSVSDSTGATSGVSSFFTINTSSGNCAAIAVDLDFVWFPTQNQNSPGHCSNWGISWQTDQTNKGVQGQVSFTFLPENGQPITVNAGTGAKGSFNFPVPFAAGTQFLAVANDHGSAGTGGVGDLYSVSNAGGSKSCNAPNSVGNGLPNGSGTLSLASSSSTSTTSASSKTKTSSQSSTASVGNSTVNPSANDSTSDHKSNTTGTAVGATFGVLGALALLGILFWWLKRKHKEKEDEKRAWGGAPSGGAAYNGTSGNGYDVSPWRWSASPYEAPQTNSRASKWLKRVSGTAATGFKNVSRNTSGNQDQITEPGHSRNGSITTSAQPYMQQANLRNLTVPNDNYALSSMGAASVTSDRFPRSPSPAHSGMMGVGAGQQNVHSTVPDTALFPPPNLRSYSGNNDDGGYGFAREQGRHAQQQQQPERSPFADPIRPTGEVVLDSPISEVRKGTSFESKGSYGAPVGRNLLHDRKVSGSVGGSVGGSSGSGHGTYDGLGSEYIAPLGPTNTSIHDPYTHMSQLWDPNNHGEMAERINHAGAGNGQIVSEVMMPNHPQQQYQQQQQNYRFMKNGQRKHEPIDEDEEGLPYL